MTTGRSRKRRKNEGKNPARDLGRREFLKLGAAGIGAASLGGGLLAACDDKKEEAKPAATGAPAAANTPAPASGSAPETPDIRFGMIALTDCSPIVIAHEKGLFKKYGINSTVIKGASWAAIRDSLSNGDIQATHMLIGMPIESTMGLLGSPQVPMIIPWLINRNGQAITVKAELKGKLAADPKVLKPMVDAAKKAG